MSITIDDLDEPVTQKLRLRASSHGRSIAAEAREILMQAVAGTDLPAPTIQPPTTPEEMRERLLAVTGIWKERTGGKTTDEIMRELRGDD